MSETIKVFDQNYIDLLNPNTTITVTDTVASNNGQSIINYLRNRSINSAWITTDSTDAANTTLEIDMGDAQTVEDILIIGHNLKNFTLHYWNGAAYVLFYTKSNETEDVTYVTGFGTLTTSKIKLTITAAQTLNADKYIARLLITKLFGSFSGFPGIKSPTHGTNKIKTTLLSGINNIVESTGAFKVELVLDHLNTANDLQLVEDIYTARRGLNYWLCGGDEDQFTYPLKGYRRKDVYLMRPEDDYQPEWYKSVYVLGSMQKLSLTEVVR